MQTNDGSTRTTDTISAARRALRVAALGVLAALLALPLHAAEVGTVLAATADGSGNLIDISFDVQGKTVTLPAEDLVGSTLLLSTLDANPYPMDANRFWTLNGAPEPTEAEALRSVGDKYLGTAFQGCASTSGQKDVLFDKPILPGPGPEIFIFHGGLGNPFTVLDENGTPAVTIPNAAGNAISVALTNQFKAWYLQSNVVYSVFGTFPHFDVQSNIVALDLDPADVSAIGGLRFAGVNPPPCDYVYEVLGRQPVPEQPVPFKGSETVVSETGTSALASIWVDIDLDGDLDVVSAFDTLIWHENAGGDPDSWQIRTIDFASIQATYLAHGDLDGDGDPDVLTADFGSGYYWYENDGGSPPDWTKRTLSGASFPTYVEPVDLDADGDLDVLVTDTNELNPANGSVAWLENGGGPAPTFTRRALGVGTLGHLGATFGDFDRDGDVDVLAVEGDCDPDVQLLESDGGSPPAFTPRVIGGLLDQGTNAAAGDLDADGDLDLIVTGSSCDGLAVPSDLVWFESDGAAMPTYTKRTITSGAPHRRVTLEDIDLDGDLDVVTGDQVNGRAGRYFSNDGGSPSEFIARDIPGLDGLSQYWLDTGDFDADGDVDLLTVTSSDGVVMLTENNTIQRSGLFPAKSVISSTAASAAGIFATDVDLDGDVDVLSASQLDDTIAWYENDGNAPSSWTRRVIADDTDSAFFVSAGDVDGDGDVDVLSASQLDDTIAWYENAGGTVEVVNPDFEVIYKAGSTTVTAPVFASLQFAFGSSPLGMTASYTLTFSDGSTGNLVDLPGWQWSTTAGVTQVDPLISGDRDMVLFMNGAGFGGNAAGTSVTQVLSETLEQDVVYTLTADFGWRTDNTLPSDPAVLELYAGGTLLTPIASESPALIQGEWVRHSRTYLVSDPGITGALEIEIGLGPNTNAQQLNVDRVRLRKEGGTGQPDWIKRTISNTADGAISVVPVDMDGDGDLDALTAANEGDTIAWYENPSWTENVISSTATSARNAVAADVDGDGDADVLATYGDTVAWYENPSWTERVITGTRSTPAGVFSADVDGDGDLDALSASIDDDTVAWHENDGESPPGWTERIISGSLDGAYSVVAADLDADGDLDALASGLNGDIVAWYENNGFPSPGWTEHVFATADGARAVFAADVDGDGDLDALSASQDDDTIAWYENRGGQFTNVAADCLTGEIVENGQVALASTRVNLNGRPGQGGSPGRIVSTLVDLGLSPRDLSTVIDTLRVYRDSGSGEFEADEDFLVETIDVASFLPAGGTYPISFPVDDPNTIVGAPVTFFITGDVTASASSSGFTSITVSNRSGGTLLNDANAPDAIRLSEERGGPSGCTTVLPIESVIVVDDFADDVDANPGDGACAAPGGACTLRAAIMEANALPGEDRISLPAGTYTLTIVGNDDTGLAGDLDILDDLVIVGSGADVTIIDAAPVSNRVLHVIGSIGVSIESLTVTNGDSGANGGGVLAAGGPTLDFKDCVIEGNRAATSGGGFSDDGSGNGTALFVDTRISGNTATSGPGGGIDTTAFTLVLRSEISGNTAVGGGGLHSDGSFQVQINGSTVSGNDAGAGNGGGILKDVAGDLALLSSTVADNDAADGGGLWICPGCTSQVSSTILADNNGGAQDCVGPIGSVGYNVVKNAVGCTVNSVLNPGTDQLNVDPQLSVLGEHGGPTRSHRLLLGSPAVDRGSCQSQGTLPIPDQTGEPRPIDEPDTANADDGCDAGAYEARLGETRTRIEIPIRWCGLRGAPSVEDPSVVLEDTVNDVLRRRHETATEQIYLPKAGIILRSAGNFIIEDYPILDDPDCTEDSPGVFTCAAGVQGDVVIDLEFGNVSEFQNIIDACRSAWEALDDDIQGITAININRFVDRDGNVLDLEGVGGRAAFGDAVEQANAARVMVIDNLYRTDVPGNPDPPTPFDAIERLLGHELGHALSLAHGNGVDDDFDTVLDNNDEVAIGESRFDGPNLLQYRNGNAITVPQAEQMRAHALLTIPDVGTQPFNDSIADGTPLDEELKQILEFGYKAAPELELKQLVEFELKQLPEWELKQLPEWELKQLPEWELKQLPEWELKQLPEFQNASILHYGMEYTGTAATDETSLFVTLRRLPWPAQVRPDTRYYIYLDADTDDATGGYPADFGIPDEPGFFFPGLNNFTGEPPLGEEIGVDLILRVLLTSECPAMECSSFTDLSVYTFDDTLQQYDLTLTSTTPTIAGYTLGLYVDNGGLPLEYDEIPVGFTIRPTLPNQVLFDAGWGFTAGPNGPVPDPVGIEVLTEIDCDGSLINDDPSSVAIDCQCTDCADCPNYPGCVDGVGTPLTLSGTRILTDQDKGVLTFEPPILPEAVAFPVLAEEGQTISVTVFDLPTDVVGDVEVTLDGVQIGTISTSAIDAAGNVTLSATLPFGTLGERTLSTGIVGFAPRATTVVSIVEALDFPDNDGDGVDDPTDPDDDNDGVSDVDEGTNGSDPLNPLVCGDSDTDGCDDCATGADGFGPDPDNLPADDGRDFDLDGICDEGDPDDDNDGVDDVIDGEPFNPDACGDTDGDLCDDCIVVSNVPSPNNDGPDFDGDGLCDFTDPNAEPTAVCANVSVNADVSCQATASIDNGSFDPEGLVQSITQTPDGPYGLGMTSVTLRITDTLGEFDECTATVTVVDATDPVIATCAVDRTLVASEGDGTATLDDLTGEVVAGDLCGPVTVTQSPAAGTQLPAGSNTVSLTVTDGSGNFVTCDATVTVLDRLLSTEEKIKVHFDRTPEGTMLVDDDDDPAVLEDPHCYTKLDLDGELQLRDTSLLPVDVRTPGNLEVDARVVISLSGQVIADEALTLDVKSTDDEKWEYKRAGGAPKVGIKKLKLDWKETASYDSHEGSGLGDDVPQIETKFIGFDETDAKLKFKDVPRPFRLTFDDPVGGTFVLDVLDDNGTATTTPTGDFDLEAKKDHLDIVFPFRLTPQTTVTFTSDGGQTTTGIPVDPEFNYQPAGAKYKLDVDETAAATALCTDPTTPVNSMTTPELEVRLFVGDGVAEVVGVVLVGPDPAEWTRLDDREWKLQP